MEPTLNIAAEEFEARQERLLEHIQTMGVDGVVLFEGTYVQYFSNFAFIPTERPIAFLMNARGDRAMFVPRMETEHARARTGFDRVDSYREYPDTPHPMEVLARTLRDMGMSGSLAVDHDGYPWILGYRGPALSELMGVRAQRIVAFIEDMLAIKSEAEIALIRESVKWANLAHRLLQRYTRVGVTETEASTRASNEATLAMMDALGHLYQSGSYFGEGTGAGYRGQIGRNAAIPHALANNIEFQPGDVLVSGASTAIWGYNSELERTMIIAPVSDEQRRMFDHMVALQDTAFDHIRPGARCSDVDRAVRAYYEEHGLTEFWKHHTGHAIGLRYHEGPFLDIGDDTEILPGMLFTVEPGLYSANLGGFRHSDTVLVTEDGLDRLTYYPRDLESLTIAS